MSFYLYTTIEINLPVHGLLFYQIEGSAKALKVLLNNKQYSFATTKECPVDIFGTEIWFSDFVKHLI